MTFQEIKSLVNTWLDDPMGGYFTDAIVSVFVNNAAKQVQKKLIQSGELFFAQTVQTTLVAGTESYTLPVDFLRLHKAELILSGTYPNEDRKRLTPITPVQKGFYPSGTGTPGSYWITRNTINLTKVPDQAYVMELLYSYLIADMVNSSDEPDIPTQYHEMIAIYATLDGFLKDQRNPNPVFGEKLRMYEEMMKQDAQDRNVDEPRYIVETEGQMFVGW